MASPSSSSRQVSSGPGMATRVARAFSRRFFLDTRSLAAFRIGLGLILVADAVLRCRYFRLMFTPEGMFPHDALHAFSPSAANWSLAFLLDATWWDGLILDLEGVAGIMLAAGFQTRLAVIIAWVALVSVVRRTAPATNAGDLWLTTLLLWGWFLPLGSRWSLDAARRHQPCSESHFSVASVALTLQIMVVYLAAGLSKCNATWLSGTAVRDALSVHDHGTPLGAWLVQLPAVEKLAGAAVLSLELAGPVLFLLLPWPRLRGAIALSFLTFHGLVGLLMSVGLFAAIGIAAWLALVPGVVWDQLSRLMPTRRSTAAFARARNAPARGAFCEALKAAANAACVGLLVLAAADATVRLLPWQPPLPAAIQTAIDLACLRQDWEMFGTVLQQEQWTYARGLLADCSEVDLLRDGQPLERERPGGGFTSLPHHRWHKLLWVLPKPPMRVFSPRIAGALAADWNANHPPEKQLRRLEICFARLTATSSSGVTEPGVLHELVVATWPPRNATGAGNLDRWLDEHCEQADQ